VSNYQPAPFGSKRTEFRSPFGDQEGDNRFGLLSTMYRGQNAKAEAELEGRLAVERAEKLGEYTEPNTNRFAGSVSGIADGVGGLIESVRQIKGLAGGQTPSWQAGFSMPSGSFGGLGSQAAQAPSFSSAGNAQPFPWRFS
jgi:hypothetical protein